MFTALIYIPSAEWNPIIHEALLVKVVADYNPRQQKPVEEISKQHPDYKLKVYDFVIDLSRYKRQYIPEFNSKGQKEVWVNCFCSTWDINWKKEILNVKDGGNCYFHVISYIFCGLHSA